MANYGSLTQQSYPRFEHAPLTSSTPSSIERIHDRGWVKSSKGKKGNLALSALTLLAFLFFLNILQNCINDHMNEIKGKGTCCNQNTMTMTTMMIPSARAEEKNDRKGELGDEKRAIGQPQQMIDHTTKQPNNLNRPRKKKLKKNGQEDSRHTGKVNKNTLN